MFGGRRRTKIMEGRAGGVHERAQTRGQIKKPLSRQSRERGRFKLELPGHARDERVGPEVGVPVEIVVLMRARVSFVVVAIELDMPLAGIVP